MEIVVRGRNVEVPEHFRQHVEDKVGQVERFDGKVIRIDVELLHEKNPRQSANCQRVEITLRGKGPVARAEACAPDFYAALELAAGKLESRMRRADDPPPGPHRPRPPPPPRGGGRTPAAGPIPAGPPRPACGSTPPPPSSPPARCSPTPSPPRQAAPRNPRSTVTPAPPTPRWSPTWTSTSPDGSSARRCTRPLRCMSTRPSTRWSWSATTSSCSSAPTPASRRWSTGGTPSTTA